MDSVPAYVAAAWGDGLQPDSESDRAVIYGVQSAVETWRCTQLVWVLSSWVDHLNTTWSTLCYLNFCP